MISREQDYSEVRRLLFNPKQQAPRPDTIVSNLMKAERLMLNEANGQQQPWSVQTVSVPSVVDQAEYTITPNAGGTWGKAYMAHRVLDNNVILPVPFTDYLTEFNNQRYEFWLSTVDGGEFPYYSGEKLAFYRDQNIIKMRIFPIPEEVRTYVISYAQGVLDWTTFDWNDVPDFPEFSDLRQARAAIITLPGCEWEGYSRAENMARRSEIDKSLSMQIEQLLPEWRAFIRNVQYSERVTEIGYWYER